MIATQDLLNTFDLIWDEVQSEFVPEQEKLSFINQASLSLFKQFVDPDGMPGARVAGRNAFYESSKKFSRYISPFVIENTGTTPTTGDLSVAALEATLGRKIYSLDSIEVKCPDTGEYVSPKWKTNTQNIQKNMPFYAPTCCNPWLQIFSNKYQLSPKAEYEYILKAKVLPLDVSIIQDSEFGHELRNVIAYNAAKLAGVAVRENDFVAAITREIEQFGV